MSEKILFVDDEPVLLQGYQRLLRKEFQVTTAVGGAAALTMIQHLGPFAGVLSDMRRPGMDGIEFLLTVKTLAPDTVRIMLTGVSELQTAIDAVNEGNIFRFLSKPSNKEILVKVLTEALAQHHLICAEKELLEKTLRGTVYVLTEVLSVVSPAAFSRAMRVRRYVQQVVTRLSLGSPWKFEVAAMMSQLGCVTLDPDTIETVYAGRELSPDEEAQYINHPRVAQDLLENIPRMEPIAWMIAHQNEEWPADCDISERELVEVRLGAQIIRAALTFDALLRRGHSRVEAAHYLKTCEGLDKRIIEAMVELEPEIAGNGARILPITELVNGVVLEQDVRTEKGLLVAAKGQEITSPLLLKLKSFLGKGAIPNEVVVSQPEVP
ncbi:MAG TPA: HD domain-containing phosphohydrolase [Terriglobia bacterium]|nr:HD domain-containing phosphohydrolase [Terriglobia bacterium]